MCTLLRSLWVYNDLYEHTMISVSIQWSLWVYNDLYENTMISMSIQWSLWEYNDLYEYTMISMSIQWSLCLLELMGKNEEKSFLRFSFSRHERGKIYYFPGTEYFETLYFLRPRRRRKMFWTTRKYFATTLSSSITDFQPHRPGSNRDRDTVAQHTLNKDK